MHPSGTLSYSPPLTCTPPARPPPRPRSVQGLQMGLNNSKVLYIPGYPSNLSDVPSWSSTTPTTRNVPARRAIDTISPNSIQTHPACFPWCAYSTGPRPVKQTSPRSVLRLRLGRQECDLRVALQPPPSRARTQPPDLTPWNPTCGLGTDARDHPTRYPSLRTSSAHSSRCARRE